MNEVTKVLIVGESWVTISTHIKGFDFFVNSTYEEGVKWLEKALESNGIKVDYLPNHIASYKFPLNMPELKRYDVVFLSDIGANTLLVHPDTFTKSIPTPNRLILLKEYVINGGGLCMIGGYLSFQGIEAKGHWKGTPIEEILPVDLMVGDDRIEVPEGFHPKVVDNSHPILLGIPDEWPMFLGYNKLKLKPNAKLLLEHRGNPFITVSQYGNGRSMAFASDCAPHWGSIEFVEWEYYDIFWSRAVMWLEGRI